MRVAAIATIYHPKSHADVIATKFMKGMSTDVGLMPPEVGPSVPVHRPCTGKRYWRRLGSRVLGYPSIPASAAPCTLVPTGST